jgi:threonine synthase
MLLYSTRNPGILSSWRDAVLSGLAPDGGLFMPVSLPRLSVTEIEMLRGKPFSDVATYIAGLFIGDEIDSPTISQICRDSWDFDAPLHAVEQATYILELFHGPTCAFKDFGARFMARLFRHFWSSSSKPLTVLVATSGDTGSAVAHAFLDTQTDPLIKVTILFPRNKVSEVQRRQMTTLGHNITAFEVDGSFDDCQSLAKQALQDPALRRERTYTSANSINIARLLPQMFYYAFATLQFPSQTPPVFVVPSGNLGNITGAIMSHMCGFTMSHGIAACNANSTLPDFLSSGIYRARASQETISNAMDVGAPSNFFRINALMGSAKESCIVSPDAPEMRLLSAYSISDDVTRETMKLYHSKHQYVLDPHTAVGAAALKIFQRTHPEHKGPFIIAATAHPAKFAETVEGSIHTRPDLPPQLARLVGKPEHSIPISANYSEFAQRLSKNL